MRHQPICVTLAIVGALTASTMTRASESALAARREGIGFWKAYTPQGCKGEFDSYDPIGLIGGALIKADCSINWRDQNGKLYCFASATSLVFFQDLPKGNILKASEAFERLVRPKPGS
jgi:hypothetical protein